MTSTLIHSQNYSQSSHYFISVLCLSDSALRLVDLSSGDINSSKFDGSSSSKCIKSLLAEIESVVCMVDCCHKDGFALECKLPAGATLCRVPPWNGSSTTDVREGWDTPERWETRCKPIRAIRAWDGEHRLPRVVIRVIVACTNSKCRASEKKSRDDVQELHIVRDTFDRWTG